MTNTEITRKILTLLADGERRTNRAIAKAIGSTVPDVAAACRALCGSKLAGDAVIVRDEVPNRAMGYTWSSPNAAWVRGPMLDSALEVRS